MFSVARLRRALAPLLLLAPALVHARDKVLFTSSVTYCEPPESLLIEQFDIAYYDKNQSIVFNISAASVDPNTNVVANLFLNVYGMNPVNVSLDICSLFGGALCPLPLYTFNGADSIPLPPSVDIASHLPGIAYTIPDIEAFAQLTLTDVKSGAVKACVQTTLSNGWSTHQYGVEWATASIALLYLALAIWQSVLDGPLALAPIRLIDLLSLYQSIALSGLLGLNYPSIYRSFTLNFAWAFGLFPVTTTSPMQQSINRMRHLTGGDMNNASDSGATSFVNRKLSPYNSVNYVLPEALSTSLSSLHTDLAGFSERFASSFSSSAFSPQVLVGGDVATVTDGSSNVLQAGIPIYTNSIGIATANAFMTIFLTALIFAAIVLGALGLAYAIPFALSRTEFGRRHPAIAAFRAQYPSFARAWGIRAALVSAMPILVFTFYQWTLNDSWLSILLSVIILVALSTILLPAAFFAVRSSLPVHKWSTVEPTSAVAPFTAPYRPNRVYYVIPLLLVMSIKALVTAFGHAHGMVQVIIFVVLEFLLFLSLVILKPHRTRGADVLAGYLCLTRLVCSGLMIAFAESLAVKPIPRVAIGAICAVISGAAVVVMFFNILVNMGLWRLFVYAVTCGRRGGRRAHTALSSQPPSDPSLGEKAGDLEKRDKDNATVRTGPSQYFVSRPNNPSPPSTVPSTPLSSTSSTTLGETLPRRWSFQHSRPPSVMTDALHSPAYTHRTSTASSPISGQRHSRNISSSLPTPLEEPSHPHPPTSPHAHPLPPLPPSPQPHRAV
ncbi:TRP-domain-containing protein [Polyporus arcularius HHB13444]|uniref:TRP-domain-containing protein n=1 Tax=Polyporus arcularius HHB13444 TaxID=1314778 RepID=A0A5C3P1E1_9APHY|nr:TRP-domain-containing protein [Polyporus arcularius HHB13444]